MRRQASRSTPRFTHFHRETRNHIARPVLTCRGIEDTAAIYPEAILRLPDYTSGVFGILPLTRARDATPTAVVIFCLAGLQIAVYGFRHSLLWCVIVLNDTAVSAQTAMHAPSDSMAEAA